MGRMSLGVDDTIKFSADTHQYFDKDGNEYQSVTRVLKKVQVPFDRSGISRIMAAGIAKEKGISHDQAQADILAEWDRKRDSSIDRGLSIHGGIETYLKKGIVEPKLSGVIDSIKNIILGRYRYYPEVILHSYDHFVAGMADLVVQRQKSESSVYDFYDYKTNEAKGIQFDSIGRKDGDIKHYNRFLLSPVDHLEDCNYNLYSLQLSMYALLAQITYGIRVGRLGIIFVDNNYDVSIIPVSYMKEEAFNIIDLSKKIKMLPQIGNETSTDDDW